MCRLYCGNFSFVLLKPCQNFTQSELLGKGFWPKSRSWRQTPSKIVGFIQEGQKLIVAGMVESVQVVNISKSAQVKSKIQRKKSNRAKTSIKQ